MASSLQLLCREFCASGRRTPAALPGRGRAPLSLRHLLNPAPSLERRLDAALEPEAVDRRRRVDGADAGEADAGPLEAALLQHPARHRVGNAAAGLQRDIT